LANDAAFEDLVAETRSAAPALALSNIADGRYFVRATAIAPSGLEGLSQTVSIRRELAALVASITPMGARRYRFDWETDGQGEPLFRLQLFSDARRDTPVVDEPGLDVMSFRIDALPPGQYTWRVGMKRVSNGRMTEVWTDPEALTVPSRGR
jgi:hypothetical protein